MKRLASCRTTAGVGKASSSEPTPPPTAAQRPTALLVTAAEAAELCGISRSTWWQRHAEGAVPLPVRIGRCTRWRRAELEAWVLGGCPPRRSWTWRSSKK